MSEFILMLTRNDVTVANALDLLDEVLQTGVAHIGFKDVGLDPSAMQTVVDRIHEAGRQAHLEVVSLTESDELRSAEVALQLGVDFLIGGTRWRQVKQLLGDSKTQYFPYPGEIQGHPAVLLGSREQILTDVLAMKEAIDGINLLAYRHVTIPGEEILQFIQGAAGVPVICAGSINSLDRVRTVSAEGTWAFTIGAAVLDGLIVPGETLSVQIEQTLLAANVPANHAAKSQVKE